jgi:hypothetical protein
VVGPPSLETNHWRTSASALRASADKSARQA